MAFTQLLPVANRNGTLSSGSRPLAAQINGATLRVDCTSLNPAAPFTGFNRPFNDPVNQALIVTIAFSWDGGATFPENAQMTLSGDADGQWPAGRTTTMQPIFDRGVPSNTALGGRPNAYNASLQVVGGPITFGLSIEEY
jgi:hypothetical protein